MCRCGTKQRCYLGTLPSDMSLSMKFSFLFQLKFKKKFLSKRDSSLKCAIKVLTVVSRKKKSNLRESESCLSGHEIETSFVHNGDFGQIRKKCLM